MNLYSVCCTSNVLRYDPCVTRGSQFYLSPTHDPYLPLLPSRTLNNEAVYARHYKYMATMPLLHYTHLPLAKSPYTYSTDYSLSLHTQ